MTPSKPVAAQWAAADMDLNTDLPSGPAPASDGMAERRSGMAARRQRLRTLPGSQPSAGREMPAAVAHPADLADRELLTDLSAACRWWESQFTWRVSSSYTGGGVIAAFEHLVARWVDPSARALALPSAIVALITALRAVGVKPGETIGVPALGRNADMAVAQKLGIRTRPLPVIAATGLLDTARLSGDQQLMDGLAAVLAVHLHGLTCDVPTLRSARPSLPIIEDASRAWAACYRDGKPVGSAADACAFSFGAARSPSAGELGCLVTCNPALYRTAVALTQHPVRQLLDGVPNPRTDQVMTRVAPAVALLGAYVVHAHEAHVPTLRRAAVRIAATLHRGGLAVLTDPQQHSPGVVAVSAPLLRVRQALRGISLGSSVVITAVDQPGLYVHPDAQEGPALLELAEAITTVTAAAIRVTRPGAPEPATTGRPTVRS